jgi:pimeloyl-ACP methyl ester carboxylesterase
MARLYLSDNGSGFPVVLLHGFPFNHSLWDGFREHLVSRYRVIAPDLPGFGLSSAVEGDFELKDIAAIVLEELGKLRIKEFVLIGHSLGGYIALSMVDQQPDMFSALTLLHSTALPDTPEKKENRNKLIDFVNRNGVSAFTGKFISPLFINPEDQAIGFVRNIALQAKAEAVIGYLNAMKKRPDTTSVLQQFHKDILIITGEKDPGITVESVVKQASLANHIRYEVLPNVAHMGMFEAPEKTVALINDFLREVTDSKKK